MEERLVNVRLDRHFTANVCQHYNRIMKLENMQVDDLYRMLMMVNTIFKGSDMMLLAWIIEQAAVHNIAGAVFFAEAVTKLNYMDLPLLRARIPLMQWNNYVRLALMAINDRYGSIKKPHIVQARYADIAQIAVTLQEIVLQNKDAKAYQGAFKGAFIPTSEAKAMAHQIKETSVELMDMSGDVDHRLRKILKCDVQSTGGYTYITPTAAHPLPAGVMLQGAGAAPQAGAQVDARVGWPQAMRQQPAECGRIAGADVKSFLLQLEDQVVKDIRAVSAALYEAASQETIPEIMENFELPPRYIPLNVELTAIKGRWCPEWVPRGALANPTMNAPPAIMNDQGPLPTMEGQVAIPDDIPFDYVVELAEGAWIVAGHYHITDQANWVDLDVAPGGGEDDGEGGEDGELEQD